MHQGWLTDIRQAWRTLRRAPGFTVVAVGTLAAGLALAVTVTTVVNAYLVRGLPYPESDRLYSVSYGNPATPPVQGLATLDWTALDDIVEHPVSWDLDNFVLRGDPHPEAAQGSWVSRGYMEAFGVRPVLGRAFGPRDFEPGSPSVVIISHRLFQARFNGDPRVLGRQIEAHFDDRPDEGEILTIVGILPEDFWHLNAFTDVLSPLRAASYPYMVRLREGVAAEVAAGRIRSLARGGGLALPEGWQVELRSTHAAYVTQVRPLLLSLAAATLLVVLIACANVAVLVMVRATRVRREIAVRKALGASGAQITRALVAEALLLGGSATMAGLGLAMFVVSALAPVLERQIGRPVPGGLSMLAIDGATLALGVGAGVLITAVCSLPALLMSSRTPVSLALGGGQKGAGDGPGPRRARTALIAIEVASCLALLVGAALMVQSGLRVLSVEMGLDVDDVLVGRITLRQQSYAEPEARRAFLERMQSRLLEVPGVRSSALSSWWPLQEAPLRDVAPADGEGQVRQAGTLLVSPDYFDALGIDLRDGRSFAWSERAETAPRVVVSETLARQLFAGRRAVGERLRLMPSANDPKATPLTCEVVGVARDVRQSHADAALADIYFSLPQQPIPSVFLYVRSARLDPAVERDVRTAIAGIDGNVALGMPRPMHDILDTQRRAPRFMATLMVVFALIAALLALVGLYGVIAYAVGQREREIAVRMAVGADRRAITQLFLRQGALVLGIGLAVGVGASVALGRLLESQLFGVEAGDPVIIGGATAAFAICGLLAVTLPARRAASTDPALALKE